MKINKEISENYTEQVNGIYKRKKYVILIIFLNQTKQLHALNVIDETDV